ncbi:MAG TPA: hypothetical protein VE623_15855 [Acidimicrobiales bacterium]|nr:hypothetical protein [Acidimicrobiales bacterium]
MLAYHLRADGWDLRLLSFAYGRRQARELEFAGLLAAGLGLGRQDIVPVVAQERPQQDIVPVWELGFLHQIVPAGGSTEDP